MFYWVMPLILFPFLTSPVLGVQLDLQAQVAQQVDKIKYISGYSENMFFELPGTSFTRDGSPVNELIKYGMDAIPYLIPYLSDTSLTEAFRTDGRDRKKPARVNEYVHFVINKIADHYFEFPPEDKESLASGASQSFYPKDIGELQSQIKTWWGKNRDKSLLERKIDDLNDQLPTNRFSAYEWLGRAKAKEGRLPLEKKIEELLVGEVNSLKQREMATCAKSLGKIGDIDSADAIRKVCSHLSYWIYMTYRPIKEGRSGGGYEQISTLFKAYRALNSLGFKDEALSHLKDIEMKYYSEMDSSIQEEFSLNLAKIEKW